jgi:hypothetical protein
LSKESDTYLVFSSNYEGIEKDQSILEYVAGMANERLCCGIGSEVAFLFMQGLAMV